MSGTSTEIALTPEESEEFDAFAEWLEDNAETISQSAIWQACATDDERIAFLLSFGPFDRFRDWLQGIADAARRRLLELKMVKMLMDAIIVLITGGAG